MRIFISWSGSRSKAVADVLSDWIKCVIQASRPWISTRDIDRGALWFTEIGDQLKDTSVGIVCLTQENKHRPWILFETGALAKGLSSNRVCTLLIDLQPADLEDPLAQFNHTLPDRSSMWGLVRTLNACATTNALDERILDQVFNTYWPQFEQKFKAALKDHPASEKPEQRSEKNMLVEILETTRFLHGRLRRLEAGFERELDIGPDGSRGRRRLSAPEISQTTARSLIKSLHDDGLKEESICDYLEEKGVPRSWVEKELCEISKLNGDKPPVNSKKA